jgi:hypothetical protein
MTIARRSGLGTAWLACFMICAPVLGQAPAQKSKASKSGEVITPPARGERAKDKLHQGDVAPDFELPRASGGGPVVLSSFQKQKPVVLIFGSYT